MAKKVDIGYTSPAEALTSYLVDVGYEIDNKTIKIQEVERDGITLAYALRYIEHWKEWKFLDHRSVKREMPDPIGIYIEGIRVDFNTPGFIGKNIYAVVNARGKKAPKTNVARSNIEITPEKEQMLLAIYELYLQHFSSEMQNLRSSGFSITWAAKEISWLLNDLVRDGRNYSKEFQIEDLKTFEKALSKSECLLVERMEARETISINDLKESKHYWTIDCASYSSADSLIKEVKSSNISALALLKTLFGAEESQTSHIDVLLCNTNDNNIFGKVLSDSFQVDYFKIIQEQRRLDLRWAYTKRKIWEEIPMIEDEFGNSKGKCYVQLLELESDNSISQIAINSSNALFILKNTELNQFLIKVIENTSSRTQEDIIVLSRLMSFINNLFYYKELNEVKVEELIESRLIRNNGRDFSTIIWNRVDRKELVQVIVKTNFIKYDTTIWYRRDLY